MEHAHPLTVGSLFSGIGGMDEGLEAAGMSCRWQVEVNPWASGLLMRRWPDAVLFKDVRHVDFGEVEPVDVLAGGFPCQDISSLGLGAGIGGARSGLWSEYKRAIQTIRPRYAIIENSPMLAIRGLDRVLRDLAALGYDAEWDCIPAAALGAPHLRYRMFIVAYPCSIGLEALQPQPRIFPEHHIPAREYPTRKVDPSGFCVGVGSVWETEPDVCRVVDGVSDRSNRIKGLGNAVVPAVAELVGGFVVRHARASLGA